jgi:hypothetical protein
MTRQQEILDALIKGGFLIDPDDEDYVAETIQLAEDAGKLAWTYHSVISTLPERPLALRRGFRLWPKPTPLGYRTAKNKIPGPTV